MSESKEGDKSEENSKFLSLILRHKSQIIGLKLDNFGWAEIEELLHLANSHGHAFTREILEELVKASDKKRFIISEDRLRIRAQQGHSIDVDAQLKRQRPPSKLFHGTATRFEASIRREGLIQGTRNYVHLSADEETALAVGARHGKPLILDIDAEGMHRAGLEFFVSENQVWLTHAVPKEFIHFILPPQVLPTVSNEFVSLLNLIKMHCSRESIPSQTNKELAKICQSDEATILVHEFILLDEVNLDDDAGDMGDELWRLRTSYSEVLIHSGKNAESALSDGLLRSRNPRTRKLLQEVLQKIKNQS